MGKFAMAGGSEQSSSKEEEEASRELEVEGTETVGVCLG